MKLSPDYFQSGETLSAAKLNTLVSAVRGHRPYRSTDWSGEGRIFRPFDPISVDFVDDKWKLILQPSYVVSGNSTQEITFGGDPLSSFPEIDVEDDKHLFFSNGILEWKPEGSSGLLIIRVIKPEEEEEEGQETREFRNEFPSLVFDSAPAFHASVVRVGDEERIAIAPGYVINQHVQSDQHVKRITPTMGGTAIDANPEPISPAAFIYLFVETDSKGLVTSAEIQGSGTEQSGTHHVPPEDDTSGEYHFLLATTATVGGRLTITKRITGNVFMPNQLVEIKNVGNEREIYQEYDKASDSHRLRTLKQLSGRGEAIIRPLGAEEEGDTIPFRRIAERDTEDAQIQVVVEGTDRVVIQGNSVEATVTDARQVSISVKDGLVTSLSAMAPVDAKDLNLTIWSLYVSESGTVYGFGAEGDGYYNGSGPITHYWRNGLYMGTDNPDTGDPPAGLIVEHATRMGRESS